jgi:DNA-binding response OmpR family regulator
MSVAPLHLRVLNDSFLDDRTSIDESTADTVIVSIPHTAPAAVRQLARQIIDSLDELLAAAAAPSMPSADSAGPVDSAASENIGIDLHSRMVRQDGKEIPLTRLEFELLAYLDRHTRRAVTREELVNAVWRQSPEFGSRTVDVHVRRLRRKLGPTFRLTTVRGFGYRFEGWPTAG